MAQARGEGGLAFTVTSAVIGRQGGRLQVALSLTLPLEELRRTRVAGVEVVQVEVRGEVRREGVVLERFDYAFNLPTAEGQAPVVIERQLRPGRYEAWLAVRDGVSRRRGEVVVPLEVVVPAELAAAAPPAEEEGGRRAVRLVVPPGEALSGAQVFTALVEEGVEKVEFLLDGQLVLTRHRPPFTATLDLGPLPRMTTVTAVGRDAQGAEVDRAQVVVNQGRERFAVRLEPITPADRREKEVRLRATVNAPSERRVAKVEFFVGEQRVAEVTTPPYVAWAPLASGAGILRVVAVLDDGQQGEDVAFVGGGLTAGVRVDAVELPVTVLDEAGKPVEGLTREDFLVLEGGVPQVLTYVATQAEVPLRLGLVVDNSGSMEKTLPEVQRVAMGFLRTLLRPTDRAFVVAFSDQPALLEPLSRDFAALGRALLALRAARLTALYDATIFSLFQLAGVSGRRALVLLSDGEDNASRHTFDQVVELAARVGAVIYTIGVDLGPQQLRSRALLQRLARASGGEAFFVATGESLDRIYARIERELRSQYLLAYTSSSTAPPDQPRPVEVRVRRGGVKVRAPAAYLPE